MVCVFATRLQQLPGQWPQPLLVLGHPCGYCSQRLYPEGQLGAPQVLFFPLGTISHTVFPSPVKWHNITCPSCSFSRAVRNQFSDHSQFSGALGKGGEDMALSACPAGSERSIPKTLATVLLFISIQHPRQQVRNAV